MTIKETVKQALTQLQGNMTMNSMFLCSQVQQEIINGWRNNGGIGEFQRFKSEQISRAIREFKHVKRVNGHYIVKGRRVPPCNK